MQNVRVEKLVKRFGEVAAVDGVSFEVPKGKLLTLLGPSGCGKTTTLNIIAGFEKPDGGDVYVGDRLISSASQGVLLPAHQRNLGMVFQSYGLWPHLRVRDNVAFGLQMRKAPRSEIVGAVERALELVRLDGMGERYPSQLSGGQQQRVAFARALVYGPDVLLLDEPLSNLDASLREEMRLELTDLQAKTGITTIFVTHDQTEAMVMSDLIIVMNRGRVEQVGTPQEIYEMPTNEFVASFVGISNFFDGEILDNPDADKIVPVRIGETVLQCRADRRSKGERVLVCVRPEDWEVSKERPPGGVRNAIESRVEKTVYMGGTSELWVRYAEFVIRIQGVHLPKAAIGNTLYLSARPQNIILIDQKHSC
jgi:iron(III) transport system ATP-binding protein